MTNTTKLTRQDALQMGSGFRSAFIVRDSGGGFIQGHGDTAEAAWTDAVACMSGAGITVVDGEPKDHTEVAASTLRVLEVVAA